MTTSEVRRLRALTEVVHAVVCFAPQVYAAVEDLTDALAAPAYDAVDRAALVAALEPLARRVVAGGVVPFPNATGLPRLV